MVAQATGNYQTARKLSAESHAAFRNAGDNWGEAMALQSLGQNSHLMGDAATARTLFEQGLRLSRNLGDQRNVAVFLGGLGRIARDQGDDREARRFFTESLEIHRELGDAWGIPSRLSHLGIIAQRERDYEGARRCFVEALKIRFETADRTGLAVSLECFAGLAVEKGRPADAAPLLAAAATVRTEAGARSLFAEDTAYERHVTAARDSLEPRAFDTAWEHGRSMTLEQAAAHAFETAK